ncbi:hypothetical protein ACTXT7_002226 [Hymenolepis weldensis]
MNLKNDPQRIPKITLFASSMKMLAFLAHEVARRHKLVNTAPTLLSHRLCSSSLIRLNPHCGSIEHFDLVGSWSSAMELVLAKVEPSKRSTEVSQIRTQLGTLPDPMDRPLPRKPVLFERDFYVELPDSSDLREE